MIRFRDVLVLTRTITPTEATIMVSASWADDERSSGQPWIEGRIRGPFSEYAQTLVDRVPLHSADYPVPDRLRGGGRILEPRFAKILEPCLWEPQHPFYYEVQLELHDAARLLDMRRIASGIRHLSVVHSELLLNGHDIFLQGVRHGPDATIQELEAWHEVDCIAFFTSATEELCSRTDRWGPMVLHVLPRNRDKANAQVVELRNHPSLLIWIMPPHLAGADLEGFVSAIRARDPSRPIAQLVAFEEAINAASPADLFFIPAGHSAIASPQPPPKPYAVLGDTASDPDASQFDNFKNQTDELRASLRSPPGLVGIIL